MNNRIVLKSGIGYSLQDFYISNLLNNEQLLNELDMKTLPETFLGIFGVTCEDRYKDILKKKIELYDKSQAVNSFIYKGEPYWLDKQQRSCMKTIAESDLENVEIVFDKHSIVLPTSFVKQFLVDLEVYAYKCYVVTAKHLQNVLDLQSKEDIINYDYTAGYPEKITLE